MAYKVRLSRRTVAEIRGWCLPDMVLEELYLYLREVLPADLEHNLSADSGGAGGMACELTRRDHHVAGREHLFRFRVFFTQDEEALLIERGDYEQENVG